MTRETSGVLATASTLLTSFSPDGSQIVFESDRSGSQQLYIMPGYQDYGDMLKKLGPHKLGKSCLYLKRLSDVDESVLKKLIKTGLKDLAKLYPVK